MPIDDINGYRYPNHEQNHSHGYLLAKVTEEVQTISGLLRELQIAPDRVAVELDRRIVKQPRWAETVLDRGAQIEIVQFVGGG